MNRTDRIVRWLACAGSFAAGMLLGGCGALPPASTQAPAPAPAPAAPAPQPQRPVALINAFGELPRPSGGPAGISHAVQQHTACDEGYDADVAVDPTGKLLAFASTRHSVRPDV
jgi:hypothetical protein